MLCGTSTAYCLYNEHNNKTVCLSPYRYINYISIINEGYLPLHEGYIHHKDPMNTVPVPAGSVAGARLVQIPRALRASKEGSSNRL